MPNSFKFWKDWWVDLSLTEQVVVCITLAGLILIIFASLASAAEVPAPTGMDPLWFALIITTPGVLGPIFRAMYNSFAATKARIRDWNRQDAVAARVEMAAEQAKEAARLLVERQDAAAGKAAEAATLLVRNTANVAEAAAATNQKLDVIHTLVNSSMTAAMQSELEATRRLVSGLVEIIDLKKAAGTDPTTEALALVKATNDRIAELSAALSDRLSQSDIKGR